MPSLTIPEHISPDLHNEKKEKNRKMKSNAAIEAPELDSSVEKKSKKEKKNKKNSSDSDDFTFHDSEESCLEKKKKSKKKEKKRKASEINEDDEEERSETSSELGEPVNLKDKNKVKLMELDGIEEGEEKEENPNAVSNFRISEPLRNALKSRGIEALFPIQAMTFNTILDGSDLVGRARTGQGKTLAFVLPILESLTNGPSKASRKTGYGRAPSVLVLLPTRELATQVSADFEIYGGALGLTSCCLYGGAPYQAQHIQLKRGVDIVVGTPGRIKDHIDRGNIDFSSLKFRVLDEADEMLRMGFVEDVELILGKVEDANKVQTLLFSATLPVWVKQISSRFLKPDKKTADLVGNERMKASADVRHIVIPCSGSARAQLIPDIIRCYSSGGRTIIFTETKDSASQLAGILPGARALHGDIQQATREVTLSGFRSGKFMTLVATNVAARGLDINAQGYSPSAVGGYGVRMDGRFSPITAGRSGFAPFGSGYGMGLNFEPGMSPNYGGNANFNNTISYGRGMSPYYVGNSNRFGNSMGFDGGNGGNTSFFSSQTRNLWGTGGLNYGANSTNSSGYVGSGIGNLGGGNFGNSALNWGSSPISPQGGGNVSSQGGNLSYGGADNSYNLGAGGYGRNSATTGAPTSSYAASNGGYDGAFADLYASNSVYGDNTWRSANPEREESGAFGYGLGNGASDMQVKSSPGFVGGYSVSKGQSNRGMAG